MENFLHILQWAGTSLVFLFVGNVLHQLFPRSKTEPPLVFHWIPFVGNAISYGMDPCTFFEKSREKVSLFFETYKTEATSRETD